MQPSCDKFKEVSSQAIHNRQLQQSLVNLQDGFQAKRALAVAALPEFEQLREDGRRIRRQAMAQLDTYLELFENNVLDQGGQVHWACSADDACKAIVDICQAAGVKTATKGKSMVTEEIALNDHLIRHGIEPVETDLGEYILQKRHEAPSHIVAPAVHLSQSDIEQTFREVHKDLDQDREFTDPAELVNEARSALRGKFLSADAGITGANFLIAENGSTVIVTNEGNGDLTQSLPKVHIVVATIERVIPTMEDLSTFLRLLARSATGQEATSYVTISNGPKRTADGDGPEAFHIVLLDNGRSSLLGTDKQDILNCIRCGACMNHCPVYSSVGGHSYGWVYPGPMGAAFTPALLGIENTYQLPSASSLCGRCDEVCPVKIPLTDIMRDWRREAQSRKVPTRFAGASLSIWGWLARHPAIYQAMTAVLVKATALVAGRKKRLSRLPLGTGWTRYRDFPAPQGRTFQSLVKERHRAVQKGRGL